MFVNRQRLLIASGWFYASLGVTFNAFGPALEAIREDFNLEYVGAGMALAALGLGYTAGSLVGGPVSDRAGTRPSIIVASAVAAVGLLLAGLSPALPAFLAALVIAAVGLGATEVAITAWIARGGTATSVRDLNLAQLGFAVGAVAAPAIVGGALAIGWGWRPTVLLSALLAASVAVAFTTVPAARSSLTHTPLRAVLRAAASPVLLLIGIAAALVVVLETGLGGFFAPFLEHEFDLDRAAAAVMLTVFWAGGFAGRLLGAWLSGRMDLFTWLIGAAVASAVAALLAALGPSTWMAVTGLALAGVASGALIPSLFALAAGYRPADAGAMLGAVIAIVGLGAIAASLGIGRAADEWTLRGAMLITPVAMVATVLTLIATRELITRRSDGRELKPER